MLRGVMFENLAEATLLRALQRLAYAFKQLAMTSWYGHEDALESIAEEIDPGITNSETFDQEMLAMDFDLASFSAASRAKALCRS
jgi:hypothetical protein